MEPTIDNLEISDIIFANYSEVYAQIIWGEETGLYNVHTGKFLYRISIVSKVNITRCSALNYSPNKLFFRKIKINSFNELETFILSKLLLE